LKIKILILLLLLSSAVVLAQKGAIGIIAGEPTGLSGKVWTSSHTAIDAGLAWSTIDEKYVHIHADYLWGWKPVIEYKQPMEVYYGIGARLRSLQVDSRFGVRGVIGLDFDLKPIPFDIFGEVAPVMDLLPRTEFKFNGGIGFRILFK
jgi:hypothetical protein